MEPVTRPRLFPVPPKKPPCRWASSLAGSPTSAGRGWARGQPGTRQLLGRARRRSVAGCPSQLPSPLPRSPYPRPGASGTALEDTGTCSLSLGTCQSPWAETGGPRCPGAGAARWHWSPLASSGVPRPTRCPCPPGDPWPPLHSTAPRAGAEAISDAVAAVPCRLRLSGPWLPRSAPHGGRSPPERHPHGRLVHPTPSPRGAPPLPQDGVPVRCHGSPTDLRSTSPPSRLLSSATCKLSHVIPPHSLLLFSLSSFAFA